MKLEYLPAGKIVNTHGFRGTVKLESWCDAPQILASLDTIWFCKNKEYTPRRVLHASVFKQFVLMDLEGVESEEAANALRNTEVFAAREDLPVEEGSFFIADLIGLPVKHADTGMHMDKPLGIDQIGYRKMSRICEARGIPLQIGYMFRSNEAINKMVEIARSGIIGDVYSVDADLDHSYGYPKYPEYASHYPGGTAYLLACHVIEWAMPIFDDAIPLKTWSILKPAPGDPEWALTHSLTVMEYPRANVTIRVCSRGTQPCRHIRIDGTNGSMELEPIEDFRTVKHTTGLNEGLAKVDTLEIRMFLKKVNTKAKKAGYHGGINRIRFKAPSDRYAGQLQELARIIRGEIPNPPGLYDHDLKVHKVSLDACNLPTEEIR